MLLLGGLSYKHYLDSIENYKKSQIRYFRHNAIPIVRVASLAITGENYANMQLPSFVKSLNSNKEVLFLKIEGESNRNKNKFSALYSKKIGTLFRISYPKNYEKKLLNKIEKLQSVKDTISKYHDKIDFLIKRNKQLLNSYYKSKKSLSKIKQSYSKILDKKSPYFDNKNDLLYLSFATHTKNLGRVSIVYDISEIETISDIIIKNLCIETLVALLFSSLLLYFVSKSTIQPLKEFTDYIDQDFTKIHPKEIPFQENKNEIGSLSNNFSRLIVKVQEKYQLTENKANIDALTGIYNRNKLDEIFALELEKTKRDKDMFSIALADIDHFKNFNDTYGHLIGDEVLKKVANCLKDNIREDDIVVRWGGEELIILFRGLNVENAKNAANKLRLLIADIQNENSGNITVSFGVTEYKKGDNQETIFKRCDDALYLAKKNGRNRVEVSVE